MKIEKIIPALAAFVAAGLVTSAASALDVAEVRGDFYYDREGQLLGHRSAELPEHLERTPMSHREKFELMGLELPPASRALEPRAVVPKPQQVEVHDGLNPSIVIVKFRDDQPVRLRDGNLTSSSRSMASANLIVDQHADAILMRAFTTDEDILTSNRETGQLLSGRELADLNNYYTIQVPEDSEAGVEIANALLALPEVETAYLQGRGTTPCTDISPTTPLWEGSQWYRDAAPTGTDIDYAWNYDAGGDGYSASYWVMDLEWDWCLTHEDLDLDVADVVNGHTANDTATMNHGTAVVGVYGACDNAYGMTGMTPDVTLKAADFDSEPTYAANIGTADAFLVSGEIMLLEIHLPGPDTGTTCPCNCSQFEYVPVEYDQASFDAISTATANGIIVVEAAGNGSVDLDSAVYANKFQKWFRDSGAIMVGASDLNHNPSCFTNHGSRIDVHGFGSSVYTTGYGGLWGQSGCSQDYTSSFSGTSSASPIVVGAAASLQGIAKSKYGTTLTPAQMRTALTVGGTPQASDFSREIAVMPDLVDAINWIEPDLRPVAPAGWDYPVVPRATTDASAGNVALGAPALPGNVDATYWNWATENAAYAYVPAASNPLNGVALDDTFLWQCPNGNLTPGQWGWCGNVGTDFVKGGRHTVMNRSDFTSVENEWSETNNDFTRQFIWSPRNLTADAPFQSTADPPAISQGYAWFNAEGFAATTSSSYWYAMAVMPTSASDDFDIRLNTETPSNIPQAGFGVYEAYSSDAAGLVDFVVLDRNVVGSGTYYGSVLNFAGAGASNKIVELDQDGGTLSGTGTFGPFTIGPGDIVEVHELLLSAGQYRVQIDYAAGTANFGVAAFDGTTGYFAKSDAMAAVDDSPAFQDEYLTLETTGDFHGLVVHKTGSADLPNTITYDLIVDARPNLVHATPAGWFGPVVPRTTLDATETFAPLPATLPGNAPATSFNFSTFNEGPTAPGSGWRTGMYVDDVIQWNGSSFVDTNDGEFRFWANTGFLDPWSIVRGGRHHLRLGADFDAALVEYSELDNDYTDWFVWTPLDLADGTPVTRDAPPLKDPTGFGPFYSSDGFRVASPSNFWFAVGAMPMDVVDGTDLRIFDMSTGSRDGFGVYREWSSSVVNETNVALVNRNVDGAANWDFGAINWTAGTGGVVVEASLAPFNGIVDGPFHEFGPFDMPSGSVIRAHEVWIDPALVGQTLYISMHALSGNADVSLALYGPTEATYSWFDALRWTNAGGDGETEHLAAFPVTESGYYGIAVTKFNATELADDLSYRLVFSTSNAVDAPQLTSIPAAFGLSAPRPNPVRGSATIQYDVPAGGGIVDLTVYDITGRRVSTILSGRQPAGRHHVAWDARDESGRRVVSGVYFVRFENAVHSETRKITVLK